MGDYASKGVGTSGLTLGIIGTTLGALATGNGGLLGGLFGNNCNHDHQLVSQLQAENAMLKSENYADQVGKSTYMQSLTDNRSLRDELFNYLKPLSEEAANNRVEIATLKANLNCCCEKQELREQILTGKINEVALVTKGRFDTLDSTIACLSGNVQATRDILNNITKTVIPSSVVCTPSTTTTSPSA